MVRQVNLSANSIERFLAHPLVIQEIQACSTEAEAMERGGQMQASASTAGRDNNLRMANLKNDFKQIWDSRPR